MNRERSTSFTSCCGAEVGNIRAGEQEVKVKMDKSDVCLMTGSVLIMAALIMWETFGMMITPTVLTVAAAGCFVATVLCAEREEELRSRKRKRR